MRGLLRLFILLLFSSPVLSQTPPFSMELEPFTISGLPGLHSYASTRFDGKWLIIGGRTNGLHGWQPPVAFPTASQNTTIYVVDPQNQLVWSVATSSLPQSIREHVTSSNMSGVQIGNYYYFIGGYGYSTPAADLITFPNITAIDVPGLMNAVINQLPLNTYFRQITDNNMALCGSNAEVLDSTIMLVFGHRFDGRYNPNNMPSFTQTYSNSIKQFQIADNGTTFSVVNYSESIDPVNFHRRDYNLVPQILPGGDLGITAFTGVFQYNLDMPYLNSIDISSTSGVNLNPGFTQQLNQYHTAVIPFYDSADASMYSFFMGGMAQFYYDANNMLTEDSLVPFVKTISYISRGNSGQYESRLPIEMPGYLGSNMEFFILDSIPSYSSGIIKLNDVDTGKVLVGYLFGGIESDFPYVFMNGGGTSWANDKIFKVYINKNGFTGLEQTTSVISSFECYPTPAESEVVVDFNLSKTAFVKCSLYDSTGRLISVFCDKKMPSGLNRLIVDLSKIASGTYIVNINASGYFSNQKIIVK